MFDPVQICARILESDSQAEHDLVERYQGRVRTLIAVRTSDREAAEELAQECLMAVLCALREGKLRNPDQLSGFVFSIARNLAVEYLRRRYRKPEEQLTEAHDRPAEPGPGEWAERVAEARREIEQLGPADCQVLTMTLVDGLEPKEIAHSLGLSPEAVRQRKSRAIKRLFARLKPASRSPLVNRL